MTFVSYQKRVQALVGEPPEFNPKATSPAEVMQQCIGWIRWSERKRVADDFEAAQRREDDKRRAEKGG